MQFIVVFAGLTGGVFVIILLYDKCDVAVLYGEALTSVSVNKIDYNYFRVKNPSTFFTLPGAVFFTSAHVFSA
jgi:hypothetical protein